MFVIFGREIRALFKNVACVISMSLFMMATAFFFITTVLSTGYSAIQPVFTNMSLVAALTVPPVAIFSMIRENKVGTVELLKAMPVSRMQIIRGKFLAVFTFFMIPTAVMGLYPLILWILDASNVWQGYITFVPFMFCLAFFIAMSFMIATIFKKMVVSLIVNYVVHVLLFTLGLISVLFGGVVETVFKWISPFRRFDPIVFDLFDLSSLLFYLIFAILFICVTAMLIKHREAVSVRQKKRGAFLGITAVFTVIAVAINVGASILPKRFTQLDVSPDGTYSISDATGDFIEDLDEDITIYVINPSNDAKLEHFINRYCEQSDRITLKEIDSTTDTEFLKKYAIPETVINYSMVVESSKRWKFVDSSECFSYYYGGDSQLVQKGFMSVSEYISCGTYYTQMFQYYQQNKAEEEVLNTIYETIVSLAEDSVECFNPELTLTPAIEYVTRKYIPTVYFISNHGEKNTASNPLDISKLEKMPADAGFVIINDPDTDLGDKELSLLRDYVKGSGRLMVLTDKNISDLKNLSALMKDFGLSAKDGVVKVDDKTEIEVNVNSTSSLLAGSGLDKVTLSDANIIEVSKDSKYIITPLLTIDSEAGDGEEKKSDYIAVSATKSGVPKLVWFTAAKTFANRDTEKMSEEEIAEYTKVLYLTRASSQWLKVNFTSNLAEGFNDPVAYSAPIMQVSTGFSVFFGFVFLGILPLGCVMIALLRKHIRKKKSAAATNEE